MAPRWLRTPGSPRFAAEWLVVGLGNPGEAYARHRHNVGFWVIDELARQARVRPKVTGSTMAIAIGRLAETDVALVKPRTFVNRSGEAIRQALAWTGLSLERLVVVHDDLDLPVGALRLRQGGGHGGHNGLKSIIATVGAEFIRVRIGIGRPVVDGEPSWDPEVVAEYVLSVPPADEMERLTEAARLAAEAIEAVLREGFERAANRYNRRGSSVPGTN